VACEWNVVITELLDRAIAAVRVLDPEDQDRVGAAICERMANLLLVPETGRRQAAPGVRKAVIRRYPYLIHYRLDERARIVIILNVKHASQRRSRDDA